MNAQAERIRARTTADGFIEAMRNTANCVAIVASQGRAGRAGITVSSMVSVSAEPPMMLVCINRNSPAHDVITSNGRFSINVLGTRQLDLANRFAGRGEQPYHFSRGHWTFEPVPLLTESAAQFDCDLDTAVAAGTHSILLGRVRQAFAGTLQPLCYSGRNYGRIRAIDEVSTNFVLEGRRPRPRLASIETGLGRTS